jgi:uncharacterized membrane protein YeaQ/YmgE (transglycosylase-associated protein family)
MFVAVLDHGSSRLSRSRGPVSKISRSRTGLPVRQKAAQVCNRIVIVQLFKKNEGTRIAGAGTTMLNIIGAIISGLVIGVLARFFYPGEVEMNWITTILLGIAGSLIAGLVTSRGHRDFSRAGCLASIIGAIVLIFLGRVLGLGG